MIRGAKGRPRAAGASRAVTSQGADADRMMILIKAAEEIFLAKGYHSATMDDVAQAAGM